MSGEERKKKVKKQRLDQLLVERGLAKSRERAKALILAGAVVVGENRVTKAGEKVKEDAAIRLKGNDCPYVSRGGLKLAGALEDFKLDPAEFLCLDIGASTGGFSDCLLQRGAKKIYTIDVGTNQLAWSLRNDPRIEAREQFHVKNLTREMIPEQALDLIVIDVSFISVTRAIEPAIPFLEEGAALLALVKPQFEAGREHVDKGGVVKSEAARLEAVLSVKQFLADRNLKADAVVPSKIKGPKGNQEFFLYRKKRP